MRRAVLLAAVVAGVLAAAPLAAAQSYSLETADVQAQVEPDGALLVQETISVYFAGSFTYGYRDIPVREGEQITDVSVSESGRQYAPGASTDLEPGGPAGTFGVTEIDEGARIVWRFDATNEERTFEIAYRFTGLAVAYDDVVDVNLKVWGDQWTQPLPRLTATIALPRAPLEGEAPASEYRAWGHPVWVPGDVTLLSDRAVLRALDVPAKQFVELRVVFPRSLLSSTAGAKVEEGDGLASIVSEEAEDASSYENDQERIDSALDHIGRTIAYLLLLAAGPALVVVGAVYALFGRERRPSGYDREYEQEPPSDLPPALVPPLLRQGSEVGSNEFTATLFDLIRRGRYKAVPVTTERKSWGGIRREDVADLELSLGTDPMELTPYENAVDAVVRSVIGSGSERLSNFRDRIEDDRTANAPRFSEFKSRVATAVRQQRWYDDRGVKAIGGAIAIFVLGAAILLATGIIGFRAVAPRFGDIVLIAVGACFAVNAVLLVFAAAQARLWRRRRPNAELEAERWQAFRRYLTDFPRLAEAPPATLELWERFLVYGIALGIAERVLQGAQLHMPEELHNASTIYWISPTGDLGSGASALAISDLSSGFGSALAPPSSGSGGFGGGFG